MASEPSTSSESKHPFGCSSCGSFLVNSRKSCFQKRGTLKMIAWCNPCAALRKSKTGRPCLACKHHSQASARQLRLTSLTGPAARQVPPRASQAGAARTSGPGRGLGPLRAACGSKRRGSQNFFRAPLVQPCPKFGRFLTWQAPCPGKVG